MSLSSIDKLVKELLLTRLIQGQSQFLTGPVPAQPLAFNLSLEDNDHDENTTTYFKDSDSRLMEMLAAQATLREDVSGNENEESISANKDLSEADKRAALQRSLHMAASNGDVERVGRLLHGSARTYVDVNGPDEEGTAPIIYASCFVSHLAEHTARRSV